MKTKHLLIALALPSLFAACTAEEFDQGNDAVALKNRIPLGDVTLSFGDNANTRLGLGEDSYYAFSWVDGDDLGASLIDTRNAEDISGADADHITGYNLTTTPQTNYRYEYNAGKWTSNAAMVEGNYVFYMPYVENTNREATMAVLPTTQTLEKRTIEGKDAYTTYNNVLSQAKKNGNIMAVAYKFLTAQGENNDGNKSINIAFKQLYATPMFTISNYAQDKDGKLTDLTIKKIELSLKNSAKFTVKSPLKYTSNASNTAYTEANGSNKSIVAQLNENLKEDDDEGAVKVGPWVDQKGANNVVKRATSDLLGTYNKEDAKSAKITINLAEPVTVKKAESFSFYAVIPGGDYSANNLVITLTTTDNLSASVDMPAVNINPGKRYAIEGYNADGTLGTGADALFNVITEKLTEATIDGIPVATQAELLQTLATAQKNDEGEAIDMKIIPAEGVVLDNQIIAMLTSKKTDIKSVTFNGDMVVNGLTNTTAVPVAINGKATLKGTVSAELVSDAAAANKIFVDGDITIDAAAKATLKGTAKAAIINNGELTVNEALTATKVTNNKTLNLAADLTANGGIINAAEGTINVTAASTLVGKLTNKGAVVVDKDKELTTAAVDNEKTITVNGTLTAGAAFENKKNAEIVVVGTLTASSAAFTNNGKITVNEGATATMDNDNSINNSVIDNAGTLEIKKNIGTINMTNTSKFGTNSVTVSEKATDANGATVWGTIMNPNGKTVETKTLNGTAGQRVWKSTDAVTGTFNLAAKDLAYNAVNFGSGVKFTAVTDGTTNDDASKFVYANFNGSTITIATESGKKQVGMPLIVDITGSVEVVYDGTDNEPTLIFPVNAKLNIAKGAELGWTKKVNITGNSTSGLLITNEGKVYNHTGSSATNIDSNSKGVWAVGDTSDNATNWEGAVATAKSN